MVEPRDKILTGAKELFFRCGIKSITMDDIAKHVGISKKTLYQFFSNKNDLVKTIMEEQLNADQCEAQKMADDSANIIEEFFALMKHMDTVFSQMNSNLFYDLQKHHPSSWQLFKEFKEECIEKMVEDSIVRGIEQGYVRRDVSPKTIARLRMQQIEMGFDPTIFPPDKFKIPDVQMAMLDHFLHGICTIKGHKLINKYKSIIEEE